MVEYHKTSTVCYTYDKGKKHFLTAIDSNILRKEMLQIKQNATNQKTVRSFYQFNSSVISAKNRLRNGGF